MKIEVVGKIFLSASCFYQWKSERIIDITGLVMYNMKTVRIDFIENVKSELYNITKSQKGNKEMAEQKKLLTYAGLKALEDELENLKVVKRKEVAAKIREAREQGDLSENAEYDAAKDEQRDIETRIEEIEKILKNAEVVVEDEVDLDKISVGCTVVLYDKEFDEEVEYKIVGSTEANSLAGKISNESPLGKALLGKKAGETIVVETQSGLLEFDVLKIDRSI